jgi:hypothetical protein
MSLVNLKGSYTYGDKKVKWSDAEHCWASDTTIHTTMRSEICDITFQYHKVACFGSAVPSSDPCATHTHTQWTVRVITSSTLHIRYSLLKYTQIKTKWNQHDIKIAYSSSMWYSCHILACCTATAKMLSFSRHVYIFVRSPNYNTGVGLSIKSIMFPEKVYGMAVFWN